MQAAKEEAARAEKARADEENSKNNQTKSSSVEMPAPGFTIQYLLWQVNHLGKFFDGFNGLNRLIKVATDYSASIRLIYQTLFDINNNNFWVMQIINAIKGK